VVALAAMRRGSATEGERRSAEWIRERLAEAGLDARIEEERATGGYWLPLGLLTAAGTLAGLAALAGRRRPGSVVAALAAAGLWDDLDLRRRAVRAALSRRTTYNVVCECGPAGAERTVLLVAHHDAAHAGLVFHPGPGELLARHAPQVLERADEDPPLWHAVIGGPVAVSAGAALGVRALVRAGTALAALATLAFLDIARRDPVPGAIDNASGVATLLELAGRLAATPPENVRVVLLWTGSEEAMWEGMQGFARRHFPRLPVEGTFVLNVDQVGDPRLSLLSGEGAMRMRDYRPDGLALVREAAEGAGVPLMGGLRSRTGTDGQYALRAGYPSAVLGSVKANKLQSAYHWPTDTPEVVTWASLAHAVGVCERLVRRLDRRWLAHPAA
jgi:Peptidase family M28